MHQQTIGTMTPCPCRQQRRSSSAPTHSTSSIFTVLFILTLHIFAGSVTVVAYAKPPSPTCPRPATTRCQHKICRSTTNDAKDSCHRINSRLALFDLRYGGMATNILSIPNRRPTSLFSSKSEGDVIAIDDGGQVKNNAKYHLIWSQNFWKKMVLSMAGWWLLQYTVIKIISRISVDGMPCHVPTSERWQGVVLPLLSSSCCAIQLVINAISGWGCAGFNTYLGPIRPVLLSLLLMSTWKLHATGRSLGWTIMSLLLAFLPELVDIWNTNRSQQWQRNDILPGRNTNQKSVSLSSLPMEAKVRLSIPTMGCVACVNKVDTSIRRVSAANNIKEEKSWLCDTAAKGGVAELTISGKTREEIDGVVKEVVDAVHDAGFVCKVASLDFDEK